MTKIERIVCGTVNCYLLSEGNHAVLVDTGEAGYEEKVIQACEGKKVRLLVLTHGHIDHIQNAAFLAKKLGMPIAMNKKDEKLIQNQFAQILEGSGIFGSVLAAVSKRKMKKNKIDAFVPDLYLQEGDTLEPYGIMASVLELPGHTEGSIAIDVERKAIVAGDTLMHMMFAGVSSIYGNKEALYNSARRISALGSRTIYFGHGTPMPNRIWISERKG